MATVTAKSDNAGQRRLMRLIGLLADAGIEGMRPRDLHPALGCSAATITRDLQVMAAYGFAERHDESGCWLLGMTAARMFARHHAMLDKAVRRLDERKQRLAASAT